MSNALTNNKVIPEEFVVHKFYQYTQSPKYNKHTSTYQGGCPICREGKSWGIKHRAFYIPSKNLIFCHNCGWSSNPIKWIMEVSGDTYGAVIKELSEYDTIPTNIIQQEPRFDPIPATLPQDSINLSDPVQLDFYKHNSDVQAVLNYIQTRKLDTAINKPRCFYTSTVDYIHKNRLILPFFDNGKIVYYQSRAIDNSVKYYSKTKGVRSLFNIDNVVDDLEYIFVFEGPIDSCFIKNGVGVAGIQEKSLSIFTDFQQAQINRYLLHKVVVVLDSQYLDKASRSKSEILLKQDYSVFIWPEDMGKKYKDFNDMCCGLNVNEIKPEYVLDNTYSGLAGLLKLSRIK